MKRYLLFCYYKIRMTLGRLLNWVGLGSASSIHYIGGLALAADARGGG